MVEQTDRPGRRPGHVPERTCVGCRTTAARSVLIRIVARWLDDAGSSSSAGSSAVLVAEPDVRRRLQGRGAWLHPSSDCLDLAVRRRALPRALRVPGPLDTTRLAAYVGQVEQDQQQG
jgi:uncharacterized protein